MMMLDRWQIYMTKRANLNRLARFVGIDRPDGMFRKQLNEAVWHRVRPVKMAGMYG
jgi:hypothetical protein